MLKNALAHLWRSVPSQVRLWTLRFTNTRFTVTTGAIVFNDNNQVLLLKHRFRAGSGWGIPGGYLKAREQPIEALRRELQEEIGLTIADIEVFWSRSFNRWRQVEILFLAKATSNAHPQSVEVECAEWFSPTDLPGELPDDQRALVQRAVEKR